MALLHLHLTLMRRFTGRIDTRHRCSGEKQQSFSSAASGREGFMNFSQYRPVLAQNLNAPIRKLEMKTYFMTASRNMHPRQQQHGCPGRRFMIFGVLYPQPSHCHNRTDLEHFYKVEFQDVPC